MSKFMIRNNNNLRRNGLSPLFGDISRWHDEVDRIFDQLAGNMLSNPVGHGSYENVLSTTPIRVSVDVTETEDAYQVYAELAGVDEKDVNVTFADGVLSLEGEKKEEVEDKQKDFHRFERTFGKFKRDIPLSEDINEEKISATFKDGVLSIKLPKCEPRKKNVKTIEIKS